MKVAILDLNNNVTNRGIGYIKRLVESYKDELTYDVFDVRFKNEIPDTSYDIYISSGGPGSPYDYTGGWDKKYFELIDKLWQHNLSLDKEQKQNIETSLTNRLTDQPTNRPKFVFFICHSFQLACLHFKIGKVSERTHGQSFGTFPCFRTVAGAHDKYLKKLSNPFWIADFRDWQVTTSVVSGQSSVVSSNIQPTTDDRPLTTNFKILAHEPVQKNNEARAIMAVRFSDEMFGTQFHPEADAEGMSVYFSDSVRKETVVKNFGLKKYNQMIRDLNDESKIQRTFKTLLPAFIEDAIGSMKYQV